MHSYQIGSGQDIIPPSLLLLQSIELLIMFLSIPHAFLSPVSGGQQFVSRVPPSYIRLLYCDLALLDAFVVRMMKASRNFLSRLSRSQVTERVLCQQVSNIKETSQFSRFTFQNGFSTSWQNVAGDVNRTYADFSIFKGKAALTVSPVLPKFSKMDSGHFKIDRKGVVLLKFMPAIGVRKYDAQRKQMFALNPTEVGSLISLGPQESCEFFHDPSMKSSHEGQVKKTLTVNPTANDGGYFVTLNITNVSEKTAERFSLPITKAEFAVLRASFSFILPHIMGWDRLVSPQTQPVGAGSNLAKRAGGQLRPDLEWER